MAGFNQKDEIECMQAGCNTMLDLPDGTIVNDKMTGHKDPDRWINLECPNCVSGGKMAVNPGNHDLP